MPHRLSKSRFLSGLQCPKRLWLEVHRARARARGRHGRGAGPHAGGGGGAPRRGLRGPAGCPIPVGLRVRPTSGSASGAPTCTGRVPRRLRQALGAYALSFDALDLGGIKSMREIPEDIAAMAQDQEKRDRFVGLEMT